MTYEVIKTINGHRYRYQQETYRENGRVKTRNVYIGPVDGGRRRKKGILGVVDNLVRKDKDMGHETIEQERERIAAEDEEYAERDRINEQLTADTISLDAINEIAEAQAAPTGEKDKAADAENAADGDNVADGDVDMGDAADGDATGEGGGDGDAGGEGSA